GVGAQRQVRPAMNEEVHTPGWLALAEQDRASRIKLGTRQTLEACLQVGMSGERFAGFATAIGLDLARHKHLRRNLACTAEDDPGAVTLVTAAGEVGEGFSPQASGFRLQASDEQHSPLKK